MQELLRTTQLHNLFLRNFQKSRHKWKCKETLLAKSLVINTTNAQTHSRPNQFALLVAQQTEERFRLDNHDFSIAIMCCIALITIINWQ